MYNNSMVITFGGNIGAGKTTIAALLAKKLGYEELYMGKIFRGMAAERGMSIDKFYSELKNEPRLEKKIDEGATRIMKEKDNLVVQGRIAWHLAESSPFNVVNIGLFVSPEVGAKRLAWRSENANRTPEEIITAARKRERTERIRYQALYKIENHLDPEHYDIVINTTKQTEDETLATVLKEVKARNAV
jgi:predicted cytidylate kinase